MYRPHLQLGLRIREARVAAGMTQKAVAEALGVTLQSVSQWENGRSQPETDRLMKLADILSVTWPWLKTGEGQKEANKASSQVFSRALAARYAPLVNPAVSYSIRTLSHEPPEQIDDRSLFARSEGIFGLYAFEIKEDIPGAVEFKKGDILIFDMGVLPRVGDVVLFDADDSTLTLAMVRSMSMDDDLVTSVVLRVYGSGREVTRLLHSPEPTLIHVMVEHRRFRKR